MTARAATMCASVLAMALALPWMTSAAGCFVGIDEGLLRPDAGAATDAGYAGVPCGDAACAPPVSVCCASTFGDTDYRRGACSTRDDCASGDYFACTSGRDCAYAASAGARCCVVRLSGGAFTQTACRDDCGGDDELCAPGASPACPANGVCRASLELPLLFQCARP
jgi:hypothetical protein